MICSQCGAESAEGQRFCYNCGAQLTQQQLQVDQPSRVTPITTPYQPTQPDPYTYQQQPPAPYQPQVSEGYAPAVIPNSQLAVISVIMGVISWIILPVIGSIAAIIFGHLGRSEIRQSGGRIGGDGLAVVGLVLGYAQLIILVLGFCAFMALIVAVA
ncbi:DUF4190 domain-containing protein [Candidatus Chloroploca sp. M-50]|uniref:DUF4190 domain-containing protein n=1 Tax=Candidatus Chloroploca mongolica TaxID=2528176 RepID=A0ABS4DCH6_9CHLR|nr:DUF4190 domain-containing protein [Candidatus Chloroploca mongolica]MBP1467146.1 DUF4190 domain-containing protein [Candidatus Chloroploca mongolica]